MLSRPGKQFFESVPPVDKHPLNFPKLSSKRKDQLHKFQTQLNLTFHNINWLNLALTHPTYASEHRTSDNQRLEYLGDSVLGMVVTTWLFHNMATAGEGRMSELKAGLISGRYLSQIATDLGFGEMLLLGIGEAKKGGANNSSNLADALEAVIAAAYLDQGFPPVRDFILANWALEAYLESPASTNFRRLLQEEIQKVKKTIPVYKVTNVRGPDHNREFTVEVSLDSIRLGVGVGPSKREASQKAAADAWQSGSYKKLLGKRRR